LFHRVCSRVRLFAVRFVCVISIGDFGMRQATNPEKNDDAAKRPYSPTDVDPVCKPELFSRDLPEDVYYALADADQRVYYDRRHDNSTHGDETMKTDNFKLVNNTCVDIRDFDGILMTAVDVGFLPEDFSEFFTLTILRGYNSDCSDRGILDMA
jgi:hypothetical protein